MPVTRSRCDRAVNPNLEDAGQVKLSLPFDDVVSCPGSRVSHSSGRSFNSVDAKNSLVLAQLKEKQLLEELRLEQEHRKLKAKNEIKFAEMQLELAEEKEKRTELHFKTDEGETYDKVNKYLSDCAEIAPLPPVEPLIPSSSVVKGVLPKMDLPRVELTGFDGDPTGYCKFVRQFEHYIESRIEDDGHRLLYLLYYCKGKAKESIEECVMLPPGEGYRRARQILKDLFGESHIVASSLMRNLLAGFRVNVDDPESLTKLAIRMQNCDIALTHLDYMADLDAFPTMEKIVRLLPLHAQHRWARLVDDMLQTSTKPNFRRLTEFVTAEARVSRSRFGQLASQPEAKHKTYQQPRNHSNYHQINFTSRRPEQNNEKLSCAVCKGSHDIPQCSEFVALDLQARWTLLRKTGSCFICLRTGHRALECHSKAICSKPGCNGRHHELLHTEKIHKSPEKTVYECAATNGFSSRVALGVLPVRIKGPNGIIQTYALLDNGSDVTLIENDLAEQVGLPRRESTLSIRTVNGASTIDTGIVALKIFSLNDDECINIESAFCIQKLLSKPIPMSIPKIQKRWKHLESVPLTEIHDKRVRILIGADLPEAHWALEQRVGNRKEPYAVKTLLGWVILGPLGESQAERGSVNLIELKEVSITSQLQQLYELEFADNGSMRHEPSVEDLRALKLAEESIRCMNDHYELALPWKESATCLPNNYDMALRRLQSLRKRFQCDEAFFRKYAEVIGRQIDKGYAVLVPPEQLDQLYVPKWYLPHHAVVNPKKPGKLRVVLDCAARYNGTSLNEMLLQGPDMTSNLVGVLMRFRTKAVAVVADIEDMFMQVRVANRDRGALRFLWWEGDNINTQPVEYQMTAHPFGAISSPFCANFALRQTAKEDTDYETFVKNSVLDNFYVDDCLISLSTVDEAQVFICQIRQMLNHAGFQLKKWMSNRTEVLKTLPESDLASSIADIDLKPLQTERTLGLEWDSKKDTFQFRLEFRDHPHTRRGILSIVSSLYDPLGLICPAILPAKALLQNLCREALGWDEKINSTYLNSWLSWLALMAELPTLRIPRCVSKGLETAGPVELHAFCDASETGYGAVVYARFTPEDRLPFVSLLFAKSRVAPLKTITIPRLELAAAKLVVCLADEVRSAVRLQFDSLTFWTDSSIVLYYIRNTSSRFSTFVANRLSVIHQLSSPDQWKHVRSQDNPADLASRGAYSILDLKLWLSGPEFLLLQEQQWQKPNTTLDAPSGIEFKTISATVNAVLSTNLEPLLSRFSEWMKLLKSVAWLIRFKSYIISHRRKNNFAGVATGILRLSELDQAKKDIVRLMQRTEFTSDLERLRIGDHDKRKGGLPASQLSSLSPILIDGILCVGGRLEYSNYEEAFKHPVILPKRHHVTELIVRHYHVMEGHRGVSHVLATIRRQFWIVQGGTVVKRVIGACISCRKRLAIPCTQMMAPLPFARVESGWYPFNFIGIDYFGPFHVKRGRGTEKRYGCLFTCLQTRAVHLEVAHDLTTDSFILTLTRFVARRGCPKEIYSDNGTNFVGARKELRDCMSGWNMEKINDFLLTRGAQWNFQPPSASHRGGVWERMIRSVRQILNAICNEQTLSDETLTTFMVESERILNDRPLVPVTSDSSGEIALTPNHLLLLRGNRGLDAKGNQGSTYAKRWRQVLQLTAIFWRRWVSEYLPTLQQRQRWLTKVRNLKVGDLVLITSDTCPRGQWPLGVVTECKPSKDTLVRQVLIKTRDGIVNRDVRKVCLLEGEE